MCVPTTVAGLNERQPDAEKDDLKDALNTMESKIRRMRDQRSNHNKSARRFADQRDSIQGCLLYTSPSPRDRQKSRMPSSA